jgi:hypothetical protein
MAVCNQCGDEFEEVVLHWKLSSECEHPAFTQRQKELLKGLVMGDGSISEAGWDGGDARMQISSTNEIWLRWLRAQFGGFASDVTLEQTGEALGERARQHEAFDDSGGAWEYSDIYAFDVRSHPFLTQMRDRWYPDGDIRYPDDLTLTPVAVKAWYGSDGGLSWSDRQYAHAAFGTHNEAHRPEFLCDLFRAHGFDPSWSEPLIRFGVEDTNELLAWMGAAPAGFEYKWECGSRDRYDKLKQEITA